MRRSAVIAKIAYNALILLFLAGCATRTVTVVPSCVPADYPQPPAYPDTADALKAAPNFAARYQLLAGGWFARNDRLESDEMIISGCR